MRGQAVAAVLSICLDAVMAGTRTVGRADMGHICRRFDGAYWADLCSGVLFGAGRRVVFEVKAESALTHHHLVGYGVDSVFQSDQESILSKFLEEARVNLETGAPEPSLAVTWVFGLVIVSES